MITAKTSEKTYELVPAGSHIARCIQMIEIGTVEDTFQGEAKRLHKVRITWELPLEKKVFKQEQGEMPFIISKEYTLSMHEKATLRKDLSSWRGRGFTDEEASAFDITKLLGVPCMINVVHQVSKNGGVYASVAGLSPLPKGLTCPDQINPTFVLSYDAWDWKKFDSLPQWLKDKIVSTPEYHNVGKKTEAGTPVTAQIDSDSLPF
jgi:hypothetical protein